MNVPKLALFHYDRQLFQVLFTTEKRRTDIVSSTEKYSRGKMGDLQKQPNLIDERFLLMWP